MIRCGLRKVTPSPLPAVSLCFLIFAELGAASHCNDKRARQFDFWLGSYNVRNYAGKLEGTDTIVRSYGNCVVQERFASSDGQSFGSSFSFFDEPSQQWHYVWVDNLGAFELFSGGRIGPSMRMTGWTHSGRSTREERMTWTPLSRGRIRQLWEASLDSGLHWQTLSDVYYWPR